MERTMKLYGNKVYGVEVYKYGLENEYLDYLTLSKIIGPCILNNYLRAETMEDWDVVAGRGLLELIKHGCLESCGVVNGRRLYVLVDRDHH